LTKINYFPLQICHVQYHAHIEHDPLASHYGKYIPAHVKMKHGALYGMCDYIEHLILLFSVYEFLPYFRIEYWAIFCIF
jgi:hypothetical protein